MPNLLSLNSYHYRRGGSDVVYFEHEEMFRKLGWNTAHMSMHHPKNEISEWSRYFVDEIEFGRDYSVLEKLSMAGKVVYSFEARRKLGDLLDRFPASVAHVHCIYHHLSPSVLPLLRERDIPVVLTAHDLKIACPAYKMLNKSGVCEKCRGGNIAHLIANRCIRNSLAVSALVAIETAVSKSLGLYRDNLSRVVAPSLFYKNKLEEWGWPANRIRYIPNYVRSCAYVPNFTPGDYFLFFGRLAPEKGIGTLIRAAIASGVRLKVAGTGPLEDELKSLAQGNDIEFLGFRSGEDLWSLVRGSKAVVLPSEWYENSPMSILESYAHGKPVIGARIGGIPEMIQEGCTGWVFESGGVEQLSDILSDVSGFSTERISSMGRTSRDYVEHEFPAERYSESMQALYAELGIRSDAI